VRVSRAWRYARSLDYRSQRQEGLLSGLDSLFVLANLEPSFVLWNFRQLKLIMFVLANRAHVANLSCGGRRGWEQKECLHSKEDGYSKDFNCPFHHLICQ